MSDATVATVIASIVTSIVTFLTVIAGFVFQAYQTNQARKADKEDRERLAVTVVTQAKNVSEIALAEARAVADKVVNKADQIAALQRESTERLAADIAANTEISVRAFDEANNKNQKIADIGAEQVELQRQHNVMKQDAAESK